MTTPTPIATFEDILAAMENNPRLQAAMRQHVLDQEFLQLPAIVRELQQAVAELAQLVRDYIAATDQLLSQIEQRLDRIEGDVAELKTGQQLLQGQFNQFRGESYEARVQSQAMSYSIIQMGFTNPYISRPVNAGNAPQFNSALQQAISDGSISREDAMDLCNADLIISGDENQHLVAEISITVDTDDIQRAVRRAGIMESATKGVCSPVIIAQNVPAPQTAQAEAHDVVTMLFT